MFRADPWFSRHSDMYLRRLLGTATLPFVRWPKAGEKLHLLSSKCAREDSFSAINELAREQNTLWVRSSHRSVVPKNVKVARNYM